MKTRVRYYLLSAAALLVACTSVLGSDYPTTVQSFGPLGYWRLNEAGPSPALHSVANSGSLGSVGNGYIVLDIGMGESGANSVVGTAARFNNGGAVIANSHNKIDVPWNAALNPTTFTIEFWAKPNALGVNSGGISLCPISAFSGYGLSGAPRIGWLFYTSQTGGWQFRMGAASGSGYAAQIPNAPATTGLATVGVWQHLAATFDGTTGKLYVNGVLIASGTLGVPWVPNPQMALRMGGTPLTGDLSDVTWLTGIGNSGNRGWDGWLDEVAVYPTALPQSTLAAHYDAAKPTGGTNVAGYHAQVLLDSPVGYWGLDEAPVSAPAASSLPTAANSGSALSAADGTNMWGSLAGQPGFNTPGLGAGNKATFMDGENGYIALKDAPALHFSGQVTMMAWVKVGAKDYFRNIIGRGWDTNVAETFLRVSMYDDGGGGGTQQNFYEVGVDDGSVNTYYDTAIFQIPAGDVGNWVHIAGTYDGAAWNLYRNGVLVASTTSSHGLLENFVGWTIGARWGPPSPTQGDPAFAASGEFFSGSIDEPAIFNTALSAANILAIYNSAASPIQVTRAVVDPGTLFKGSSKAFNVWAEGDTDPIGYLWLLDGASTGVTATNYTATNLQNGTHTVSVVITNVTSVAGSGTFPAVTNSVTFNVIPLQPTFTNNPVSITRYTGRPAFFSVVVGGSQPMTLKWQQNGVPLADGPNISGATTANLTISNCAGLDGKLYSCIASNEANPGGFPNGVPSTSATLSVLALPNATAYAPAIIGDTPDAYWRLGESSGTVAHDYYNGHDGTYQITGLGNPGYSLLDPDTAVSFNGLNSHVANINGSAATGGVNYQGHRNFTLEAWVNGASGQQDGAAIIAKGNGPTGTSATEQFSLEVSGGAYVFLTRGGGNATFSATASSGPDGTWQHVVGVYDDLNTQGGGALMYIYVNGVQEGSGAVRASGLRASTDPVSIGSKRGGNDPNYDGTFNGLVDEVATYGYALTHAQVVDHYTDAYGTSYPASIALQPQSASFYKTLPATLSVEAYGTQPLTYQWTGPSGVLSDNGIITGSSTRTLKIDPVDTVHQGNYSVTINNVLNIPTNSHVVVLTVLPLPTGPVDVSQLVMHLTFNGVLTDATGRGNNGTGMHVIPTNSVLHITGLTNTATPNSGNQDFKYVPIIAGDGPPVGQGLHYASYTTNGDYGSVIGGTAKTGGTTSTNAYYVTLGNRSDLVFGSNVNFSVAYWVRFPPWNGAGDLGDLPFFCSAVTSFGGQGYTFAPSYNSGGTGQGQKGGSWSYSTVNAGGSTVQLYGPNFVIDDGNWHHLAHTYDRVGLALTYLDGRQVDSRSAVPAGDINTGNTVSVGQDPTGSYPESGAYDIKDMGVWRKALTATEVAGVYLAATNAGASFTGTYTPPSVTILSIGGGKVQLTWPNGRLQSATTVTGPYTDVLQTNGIVIAPAASPYTNTASGKKYYRAFD